jgi:methyl-accepting chemotaxis protein
MKNMSMSKKIYGLLGILVVVAAAISWVGISRMALIDDHLNQIADVSAQEIKNGARVSQNVLAIVRAEKNIILAHDVETMRGYIKQAEADKAQMAERLAALRRISDESEKAKLAQFEDAWAKYLEIHNETVRMSLLNSNVRAKGLSKTEGRMAIEKAEKAIDELAEVEHQLEAAQTAAGGDLSARALVVLQISHDMLALHRAEKNLILEQDDAEKKKYAGRIEGYAAAVGTRLASLEKVLPAQDMAKFNEFKKYWSEFLQVDAKVQAASLENGNEHAALLSATKGREAVTRAQGIMREIVDAAEKGMQKDKEDSAQAYLNARLTMLLVSAIGIIGALALAVFILMGINRRLREVVNSLDMGAEQTAAAAGQVSGASQSLASGSSEQAASLEETSSSLEEITSMVRQNADNASQANQLAQETNQVMSKANQAMNELTASMNEINAAGEQTGRIIKTIDEIAFQTNLLALNAAVEAARAGEAGAGFAVVADEVRNLAQRAAEAAKNTAALIEGTIKKTKEGAELVAKTNEAFSEVRGRAGKVGELVGEIAAASNEQAQGITQINVAMSQVDKVTQEMAANAEESASASEELNAQAETMRGVVKDLSILVEGGGHSNGHGRGRKAIAHASSRPKQVGMARQEALPAPMTRKRPKGQASQAISLEDDDFQNF